MRLLTVDRQVIVAQCKGCPLQIQVGYTAVWLLPGSLPGFVGTRIGLFIPRKTDEGYRRSGFRFHPYLWKNVPRGQLPRWYRCITDALSYRSTD